MSREIPLTKGFVAVVDDEDFDWLTEHRWKVISPIQASRYAVTYCSIAARSRLVQMHRLIVDAKPGQVVDHINGDGLDNRRENLRLCSRAENGRNRRLNSNNTTGYKGVYRKGSRFRATITLNREQRLVGSYRTAMQAARAYDEAAVRLHGDFASLNFSPNRDWLFAHEQRGAWPPKPD